MRAAADEEVHVVAADREVRRRERPLRAVEVEEAVDQPVALEAGHRLLPGKRAVCRPASERRAGRRPAAVVGALEVGEDVTGRRRVRLRVVSREALAVEVADEVLRRRAAGDPARVEVDDHHPLGLLALAVDREREQVRALPDAAGRVGRAEVAEVRPVLEVGRAVDGDLALDRLGDDHPPLVRGRVPEHLRVAELARADVEHRVAGVALEGAAAVGAVGQRLRLRAGLRRGVDRHHRRVRARPEPARVVLVDHRAAREHQLIALLGDRHRQLAASGPGRG